MRKRVAGKGVSKKGRRFSRTSSVGCVPFQQVSHDLASILGATATTVVLKQIFPTYTGGECLYKEDFEALKQGLQGFFGDAGMMLYKQATRNKPM
ncbi:MAG: hypothetical protein QW514_00660 [Thermoprotei archaeon]